MLSSPHNLPDPTTDFLDRERETAEVVDLMARARLLTLTGPGGVGKTRVALAAARRTADRHPDGVWLVDLAPRADGADEPIDAAAVARAIAEATGVRDDRRSPIETIADALGARRALLLLDNCERATAAAAAVAGVLLASCPAVSILATSRQPLGHAEEARYPIGPLELPDPSRPLTTDAASGSPAVQLFVDRARARAPGFQLTPDNVEQVVAVCRRLEGLPLAIELAVGRLGVIGVAQLAARLDAALDLLGGRGRVGPRHHRTMRAALAWSHDDLAAPERALLRRLAAFAGGWTLESAEAVCGGDGLAPPEILDLLQELLDRSLALPVDERRGVKRYRFHEVVRQFAAEQLRASGEEQSVRAAHAAHFLAFARRVEPELWGPDQRARLDDLAAEHDNLRAALAWCLTADGGALAETGLALAAALWWFWFVRGHVPEGRRALALALDRARDAAAATRGAALYRAGHLAWVQGDYDDADGLCAAGEEFCATAGDGVGAALARGVRAYAAYARGDYDRAEQLGRDVLGRMRLLGHGWGEAVAHVGLGIAARQRGEYARAKPLLEHGLARHRGLGDLRGEAEALNNLALVARERGSYAEAAALHEAALERFHQLGDEWQAAGVLVNASILASRRGEAATAASLCRRSLLLYRRVGDRRGIATCVEQLAALDGSPARRAMLLGAAEAARRAAGLPLPPDQQAAHDAASAAARARLPADAFQHAWTRGSTLPLDRAVDEALRADEPTDRAAPLTPRQREIAMLVARGLSNAEIADHLVLSVNGVKRHVHNILERLALRSRTQLANWVRERGVLAADS